MTRYHLILLVIFLAQFPLLLLGHWLRYRVPPAARPYEDTRLGGEPLEEVFRRARRELDALDDPLERRRMLGE